jgi:lipopolysaccharide biosynthesis glycosyltransferase
MSDVMEIVTACDQAFLPGLNALLNSIRRHEPDRIVHLLDCGIAHGDRAALTRQFPNLRILTVDPPAGLPAPSVGSHATYARLLVGDLFPKHERMLYLDADVVLMSDLRPLDALELAPAHIAAACIEPYTPTFSSDKGVADFVLLGFVGDEPYFNAGVLLIDIARWNRAGVGQEAMSYLKRDDLRIASFDQEALNVALAGHWYSLDPEWNVSRYWMYDARRVGRPNILRDARIVHFLSEEKPWISPDAVHPWLLARYREHAGEMFSAPPSSAAPTPGRSDAAKP